MLISENGDWWGGISGGCLEGDMLKKAQFAMMSQSLQTVQYDTREDDPFELGIGLGCNGLIDILIIPDQEYLISFADLLERQMEENVSTLLLHICQELVKASLQVPASFGEQVMALIRRHICHAAQLHS
jgi:xanthine/CO dehydrogenase XdhC/CoxF family maturation factor